MMLKRERDAGADAYKEERKGSLRTAQSNTPIPGFYIFPGNMRSGRCTQKKDPCVQRGKRLPILLLNRPGFYFSDPHSMLL